MANYAHPLGNPKVRYLTTAGAVLNGGKLYAYAAGTTTAKTTWEDGAMQTANSNPVVLDAYGQASVYCQGRYKFILKNSAGSTQWTEDNVWFPTITDDAASVLDDTSASAMRATLGLGTAAVLDTGTDAGDVCKFDSSGYYPAANGSLITDIASGAVTIDLPYGYLSGCSITRITATTFRVAVGEGRDSTDAYNAELSATMTKNLTAWSVGDGGGSLDTGSLVASKWWHVFLIVDTAGNTDVCISTEGNAVPTTSGFGGRTYYRDIGSIYINGSSQIDGFSQNGDIFLWDNPVDDLEATTVGTAAVTRTLTVPPDKIVQAIMNVTFANPDGAASLYLSPLSVDNEAPAGDTTAPLATIVSPTAAERYASGPIAIRTNTSKQIRSRASLANSSIDFATLGWIDARGK